MSWYNPLFLAHLYQDIAHYLNQKIDLKPIIENLIITSNTPYKKDLEAFKNTLLTQQNIQKSFSSLNTTQAHNALIKNAIQSNKLPQTLLYISTEHKKTLLHRIKKSSQIISTITLILTGTCIGFGFYLTLLPITQLIQNPL
jgi:type II secretory pathway component PulF